MLRDFTIDLFVSPVGHPNQIVHVLAACNTLPHATLQAGGANTWGDADEWGEGDEWNYMILGGQQEPLLGRATVQVDLPWPSGIVSLFWFQDPVGGGRCINDLTELLAHFEMGFMGLQLESCSLIL